MPRVTKSQLKRKASPHTNCPLCRKKVVDHKWIETDKYKVDFIRCSNQ